MGLFSRSKITSDEYTDLSAKIVKLSSEVLILKAEMEKTEERLKSFHGRLTKRIKEQEEEEEETEQPTPQELQRYLMGFGNGKE
jgi:chromosome segregation ATPase